MTAAYHQYLFFLVCRTNFLVCRKKNLSTLHILLPPFGLSFSTLGREFCHLIVWVLPPYGISFATLWREFCHFLVPSTNKQSEVQKSVAFSLGGGACGCGCVEVSLRTACSCQKQIIVCHKDEKVCIKYWKLEWTFVNKLNDNVWLTFYPFEHQKHYKQNLA